MPKGSKAKTKLARKELFLAALVMVASLAALLYVNRPSSGEILSIKGQTIKLDIADDLSERQLGLSGRDALKNDQGMLFVFEQSSRHGFWMKDMEFSIDIIWMDENRRIVHIEENATPASYPDVTFLPNVEALYVLELYTGQVAERDLNLGDQAEFSIR